MPRCFLLLSAVLVLGAPAAEAQPARSGPVSGQVVDAKTGTPLPGAHVFFSTTTKGMAADAEGRFLFTDGVPVGTQRLHASMMGYEAATLDTLVHAGRRYRLRVALEPAVIEAEAVDIAARRASDEWKTQGDEDWDDLLEKFERLFIGETPEAEAVTLQNPDVLAFDPSWWGKLRADAGAPLVFENRTLGYRVHYHLKEFEGTYRSLRWDGEPLFEELPAADSAEAARWARNRRRAFRGSLRHFLLALLGDSLDAAGFRIRREPRPGAFSARRNTSFRTNPERLLASPPAGEEPLPAGTKLMDFSGRLRILYTGEPETHAFVRWQRDRRPPRSHQRSYIELNDGGPVTIDPAGEIVEPYGATLFGYFAFERLAVLLPKAYRP